MAVRLVSAFVVQVPTDVTFTIDPKDEVVAMRGTLFQKKGTSITLMKTWNASQLKNGVRFRVEADVQRMEVVVSATVSANTSLQSNVTFDPTPPEESNKKVNLKKNEGLIERLWLFLPQNIEESEG